jgi:putative ABC transport system permease protein
MTELKYIFRSIIHFRKQHLALFLSMTVSAAVLTGALIVGDSIRFSLKSMVDARLGKTKFAISGGSRFMDTMTASKLSEALKVPVAPILMLKGIAVNQVTGSRVNNANVIGVDSSFAGLSISSFPYPSSNEVVICKALAKRLNLKPGEELLIRVGNANLVPVNTPFSREPVPTTAFRLTIKSIADDDQLGRFNLGNDQSTPINIFVSNSFLCKRLSLEGLSNIFLLGGEKGKNTRDEIIKSFRAVWSLKDLGLSIVNTSKKGTYDLVSNRIFIDTIIERSVEHAGLPAKKVISYMVNDIGFKGRHTPYSFASAVTSSISGVVMNDNEAIINRWTASDLGAGAGDSIKLTYFTIGPLRELQEVSHSFRISKVIENTSDNIDRSLMPQFQGLSDAGKCRDWDAGVPIDLKRIRDKDEKYWSDYRGTPKVIISLETGRKLWHNQFGSLTAIRFNDQEVSSEKLSAVLLNKILPSEVGIQVVDVHGDGAMAAGNAVDFTELFLSLSFFIIAAGILLTALIYSLHFNRRSSETALLSGLGFSQRRIILLRLLESSLVIFMGSIAGSLLGILYNSGLVAGLNSVWNDIVRTNMLMVHINAGSLITGALTCMTIAVLPVFIITVRKLKRPIAGQLKGNSGKSGLNSSVILKNKSLIPGPALLAFSLILVIYSLVTGAINDPLLYLLAAALFISGSLVLINGLLRRKGQTTINSVPSVSILAMKNLQRNSSGSLSVISLLAIGTFAIMVTASYRKTFYGTELLRKSGTGGYLLWAETTSPVPFNLNSSEIRSRLLTDSITNLNGVMFLQFARLKGDDASCLNLNQAQHPQLLAVNSSAFDSVGAFSFEKLLPGISREHPWKGLEISCNDSTYPAFADQNVIQYSLKKKLGDTLIYNGESGKRIMLVLSGSMSNSVFQGSILVSDKMFRKYFPSSGGSEVLLVDAPENKKTYITDQLTASLADYGIEITPTGERLATFNSVENTYLSVFMALSGLGFLIGTIGLGIVLLRNILERKQELALMISLGFSRRQVFKIIFTENLILLVTGFVIGVLAATAGILPSLISPSFNIEWSLMLVITTGLFLSGLAWIYFPLRSALKKPLITALRPE